MASKGYNGLEYFLNCLMNRQTDNDGHSRTSFT